MKFSRMEIGIVIDIFRSRNATQENKHTHTHMCTFQWEFLEMKQNKPDFLMLFHSYRILWWRRLTERQQYFKWVCVVLIKFFLSLG